jgi:hypothetical protein
MFREGAALLQVIQLLPASTDRIPTEVLKATLYLQAAVLKDPVHLHITALLQAGHTAAAGNPEVLILQDLLHQVEVVLLLVEVVLHPAAAAVDHHPAGVSIKR